jgi:hypothetical protein
MSDENSTFGMRLKWAIDRLPRDNRRRGNRHFLRLMVERAEAMAAEGRTLPGVQLSTIQGYLRDEIEPSRIFQEEAARLLNVCPAWLAFGLGVPEGPPAAGEGAAVSLPEESLLESAARDIGLEPSTRALLSEVWQQHIDGAREEFVSTYETWQFAGDLLRLLNLPDQYWGLRHDLSVSERNHYARAILNALMLVMPAHGQGDWNEDRGTCYAISIELPRDLGRASEILLERVARGEQRIGDWDQLIKALDTAQDTIQTLRKDGMSMDEIEERVQRLLDKVKRYVAAEPEHRGGGDGARPNTHLEED